MKWQPSLMEFESARRMEGLIPPKGSNSFYDVSDGKINLLTTRDYQDQYRFQITTNAGTIETGTGTFWLTGNMYDIDRPYDSMTIIQNTTLKVTDQLHCLRGSMDIHGTIECCAGSVWTIEDSKSILYPDSTLTVAEDAEIHVQKDGYLYIYGRVNIHLSRVDDLLKAPGVIIDSCAVIHVTGIEFPGRPTCMNEYENQLRNQMIIPNTQGELNTVIGRMAYAWREGDPDQLAQVLQLSMKYGHGLLGDFKLSILGIPKSYLHSMQLISELVIEPDTTFHITEQYESWHCIRPELYIGIPIGNSLRSGRCVIRGSVIAQGERVQITLDRGGSLYIEPDGLLKLSDDAKICSTYNGTDRVLYIQGTLEIDSLEQLQGFEPENIYFGDRGKLMILNPNSGTRKRLLSIPNGIQTSELYRLFRDRLDRIEYHISENTGIEIDQYFPYYARDLYDWYGGKRIEQAIALGWVVWHDNGFIQLDQKIIPWVHKRSNLYDASKLFNTTESTDALRLQDVTNRLRFAGCGNIRFRFIHGSTRHEVTMDLKPIHLESVYHYPMTDAYQADTDKDGMLCIRNMVPDVKMDTILNPRAYKFPITDHVCVFSLDRTSRIYRIDTTH